MKAWQHFKTILNHKKLVRRGCFSVGLYWQGLKHDLSKYSPVEFLVGCRYYQGNMSPNNAERFHKGYSAAWLHHKGRNKHHLEYWIDYDPVSDHIAGMKMPKKYVIEMFIDRMSACKNYMGENYKNSSALEYYERGRHHYIMHDESRAFLEKLLHLLADEGEDKTFQYIKRNIREIKRKERRL
ncbi:MAG: DUF5662 family protein [Lachnospiraceae bacterium]